MIVTQINRRSAIEPRSGIRFDANSAERVSHLDSRSRVPQLTARKFSRSGFWSPFNYSSASTQRKISEFGGKAVCRGGPFLPLSDQKRSIPFIWRSKLRFLSKSVGFFFSLFCLFVFVVCRVMSWGLFRFRKFDFGGKKLIGMNLRIKEHLNLKPTEFEIQNTFMKKLAFKK